MNKKIFYTLLVTGLVVLGILIIGFGKEGEVAAKIEESLKIKEVRPLRNVVEIKAEGEILHYQRKSIWKKKDSSEILRSRKEFESKEINSFKENLRRYYVYVVNPMIKFNEEKNLTVFLCDVKGARYSANSYNFHWLLGDLPFDLYQFKRSEKELTYQGEVNGVPTIIRLIFPYPIAHCHEHVWPR